MAYEDSVCHQCGGLRAECSDPDRDWHPHLSVCYAAASREWGRRRLAEKYKDETPHIDMLHPLDGAAVWAAQVPPEGDDPFELGPVVGD